MKLLLHVFWVFFSWCYFLLVLLIFALFACPSIFSHRPDWFLFASMSRRCRSLWRQRSRSASVCSNDLRKWMWKPKLCFGGPPSKIINVWWLRQWKCQWSLDPFFFARLLCYFFITLIILACFDYINNYYNLIEKELAE